MLTAAPQRAPRLRLIHVSPQQLTIGTHLNGYGVSNDPNWQIIYDAAAQPESLTRDLLTRWYATHTMVATVVTEAIYERVRRDEFPNVPSRLGSAFACGRPEAAMYFALLYRSGRPVWFYELSAKEQWIADMKGLNPSIELDAHPIDVALDRLNQRANAYWGSLTQDEAAGFELPEIVLPQRGQVVRELTPPFMP